MKSPATAKPALQPHVAARQLTDDLAELRRAIITAQDRRASVAASPLPMSEALACLDAGLAALANDATDAVLLSALVQPARRPQLVIHDHPSALRSLAIAAGQGTRSASKSSRKLDEPFIREQDPDERRRSRCRAREDRRRVCSSSGSRKKACNPRCGAARPARLAPPGRRSARCACPSSTREHSDPLLLDGYFVGSSPTIAAFGSNPASR